MNNLARIDDILLLSRENVQTGKIMDLYRRVKRPDYDEKFLTSLNEMRLLLTREIYEKNTNLEKAQYWIDLFLFGSQSIEGSLLMKKHYHCTSNI